MARGGAAGGAHGALGTYAIAVPHGLVGVRCSGAAPCGPGFWQAPKLQAGLAVVPGLPTPGRGPKASRQPSAQLKGALKGTYHSKYTQRRIHQLKRTAQQAHSTPHQGAELLADPCQRRLRPSAARKGGVIDR